MPQMDEGGEPQKKGTTAKQLWTNAEKRMNELKKRCTKLENSGKGE